MLRLLQINTTVNWGSTGKIAEEIAKLVIKEGFQTWMAYGRGNPSSVSNLIRIGNDIDMKIHAIQTRLFDNHGLASRKETNKFIKILQEINPDIIHLHNLHGYYLNYPVLFKFLKEWGGPVVWTLHDCWPFTGHCAHYTFSNCDKWQTQCYNCPNLKSYPSSLRWDRSTSNYKDKKEAFLGLPNLTLVPVSNWLGNEVNKSFLKEYPIKIIHNGLDLNTFHPIENIKKSKNKTILGVASVWDKKKGLEEFIKLRDLLPGDYDIILVGLNNKQVDNLPKGIIGINRTENQEELVRLYNQADVFINPSAEETLGMTTIEALACGTPAIVYDKTAVPEPIDKNTGLVIPYGDTKLLADSIIEVCENHPFKTEACRDRAELLFDKNKAYQKYLNLYNSLLNK